MLRAAGWYPGRKVDVGSWAAEFAARGIVMHDAARRFLEGFGGLNVEIGGPGISCAREPFELDPAACPRFSEVSSAPERLDG